MFPIRRSPPPRRRATACKHSVLLSRKNGTAGTSDVRASRARLTVEEKVRCAPFREEISNLHLSVKAARKKERRTKRDTYVDARRQLSRRGEETSR